MLRSLKIDSGGGQLDSLSFLAAGTLPSTLTNLSLSWSQSVRLPVEELAVVHGLRALERLHLRNVFDRPLLAEEIALYRPPSALTPALRSFACTF